MMVRHELTDAKIKALYKAAGIDTRKKPPTREELFSFARMVFKAGSEIDVMHVRYKEKHVTKGEHIDR